MNWYWLRYCPWIDTRAHFVSGTPYRGRLLDLGSSDGETLSHFAELRPDLHWAAADLHGQPKNYPPDCDFQRVDFEHSSLPWPSSSMDAISCMHVLEHLHDASRLLAEIVRLLKPGGRVYFETPHFKTLRLPSTAGKFTMNFYDDPTHIRIVSMDELTQQIANRGLQVEGSGISRNWFFAALHPIFVFLPDSRRKFTARVHWLGWSAYLAARRPA